ncbi:MAG: hypothetical protein D6796_05555 [Caldilineae bacterium]|nr:MAG: hypothetical protein D6796_05555 [Caldilineae bacterium]
MTSQNRRVFWGVMLIVAGIFFLLDNFRLLGGLSEWVQAALFGMLGLLFLGGYLNNRRHWWSLFPAAVLLGLAGTMLADQISFLRPFSGGIFLFCLSLAFWAIFVGRKRVWWPVIPAGVLTTLAFVSVVDEFTRGDSLTDSLFFIGIGLTFGVLWLIRHNTGTEWALWPALAALGFGLFMPLMRYFDLAWPLVLIAVGAWLLWRNLSRNTAHNAERET